MKRILATISLIVAFSITMILNEYAEICNAKDDDLTIAMINDEYLEELEEDRLVIRGYNYTWPLPASVNISGRHISNGSYYGVDMATAIGTDVFAIADGTVMKSIDIGCTGSHAGGTPACNNPNCPYKGTEGSYCNYIVINHGNNIYSLYAHLKTGSFNVKENDFVKQGQKIAESGNAGKTKTSIAGGSAAHLHFEFMDGGYSPGSTRYNKNPSDYLTQVNVSADIHDTGVCFCSEDYAGTYTVTTNSDSLNIRSGHGSSFSSLGTIQKGATVTVTKASGTSASDWAHVEYNGISGYASMEYLTKQEPGVRGTEMTTGGNQVIPDGNYIIVAAAAGDENCRYYLDIDGADVPAVSGTNVHLWSGAQSAISACDCWHLSYSDGFYTITQIGTSMSLDVTDGDTLRGKNIQVCEANGSSAQKWAISWNGRNGYTIQAKCSGYCLDVQDIKFEAGTNINQWENNGSDGQAWSFIPVKANVGEDFWALILNTSSWKPIAEAADGNVELASEGGDNYERELWHFVRLSDGTYNIYSAYSGNCLHVVAGADANGANIICYPWRNESYEPQKWSIITKGDNQYFFMPTAISSTRVLDVKDGLSADGTNLQLCDLWCGSPQVFSLYVLGSGDQADYSISAEATELDPGASTTVTVKGTGYINSYKLHIIAPDGKETVLDNKGKQTFQFTAEEAGTYTLYAEVASPVSSSTGSATDRSIQIKVKGSEVEPVAGAKITLASATASAGEEIAIPVALTESPGVVSVEFSVQYDASVLEWTGVLEGEYGGNFDGETGSMITWYAADPRVNETKDGVLATLVFRVKDDAPEGQTEVSITYEVDSVYNADEANVALAVTPGVITVSSYIPGDINGDGKVNNKDVTRLMRYIKYKDVEVVEAALDVNGDGKINNKDVTRLMRHVKYKDVEIH